jgi:hypothetical protein
MNTTAINEVKSLEEVTINTKDTTTEKEVYFSQAVGLRMMVGDSILDNEFISGAIDTAEPNSISYEDDHVMLMVGHSELAHFLHLAYQYSEKNLVVVLDGTFEYKAIVSGETEETDFIAQLMTITESHINK